MINSIHWFGGIFYALLHSPWMLASWAGFLIFGYSWPTLTNNVDDEDASQVNLLQTEKLDRDGSIPLTAGLKWPATQVESADVNTLDDYEEGTWVPGMTATDATITLNPSAILGAYTKIGRLVSVSAEVIISNISFLPGGPSGTLRLTGLPFASKSDPRAHAAAAVWADNLLATATGSIVGFVEAGTTDIILEKFADGEISNLGADIQVTTIFIISATYVV